MKGLPFILFFVAATIVAVILWHTQVVRQILANYTPIDFYGKVVDQDGVPVAGARVVATTSRYGPFGGQTTDGSIITDDRGAFAKHTHGQWLTVQITKPRFRTIVPRNSHTFDSFSAFQYASIVPDPEYAGPPHTSPTSPAVFEVYKIPPGEPLVYHPLQSLALPEEGETLRFTLDPEGGKHTLTLRYQTVFSGLPSTWGRSQVFEFTATEGGIQIQPYSYDNQAPEDGYHETYRYDFPIVFENHRQINETLELRFFLQFADGVFALVHLDLHTGPPDRRQVVIESSLNPRAGSRNLEAREP